MNQLNWAILSVSSHRALSTITLIDITNQEPQGNSKQNRNQFRVGIEYTYSDALRNLTDSEYEDRNKNKNYFVGSADFSKITHPAALLTSYRLQGDIWGIDCVAGVGFRNVTGSVANVVGAVEKGHGYLEIF